MGFSTLGCPQYNLEQVMAMAKGHGFTGLELRFLKGQNTLHELPEFNPTEVEIKRTKERIAEQGLEVVCVDTSVRFASPDRLEREKQLEMARVYMDIAQQLGAPYIRVFGGPIPQDQDREEATRRIAEGLAGMAGESERYGVMPLLEIHDSFCTSEQIEKLFSYATHPRLGLLWDFLHSHRHGEHFEDTYRAFSDRIKLIHVKDSAQYSAAGFDLKLPGQGNVPIAEFVAFLKRAGYEGYVNFEWEKAWHPEIEEPEVAIPAFSEYMKPLLFGG
jgi:sugar phosphate isomerase/epimerase